MADRVVSIRLIADATGIVQGFGRAKDAAGELKAKVEESARSQRQEWATVGAGVTAVGVAITGVGAALLKTGIQYNTLQQTTRAALTTLLGSAQAANAQMDKLDEFARSSPFSKAVFIEAQQQLLGFGMEAERIVPTLDAIQNAVAATGGSNQDIAELTRIIAQLEGGVKLSAETFNQFGARGIDAAQLIGDAMGKTGAQIRAEVTAGTLDADTAIQALTDGMQARFSGAAANVKNTFEGSMDRVKAAWRDFASELAKPLVDPNGGGALIDLLNWTADAMRNFQKLPEPVKQTASALTGVVGGAALLGGTFMLTLPKVLEFRDALSDLGLTGGKVRGSLAAAVPVGFAVALAAASAHLVDMISEMRDAKAATDDLARSLKNTESISADLERGFSSSNPFATLGAESAIAENNLRQMNTGVGKLRAEFEKTFVGKAMSVSTFGFGRDLGQAQEQIEELDTALAGLVSSGRASKAAAGFAEFAELARKAGWSQQEITDALPEYAAAQKDAAYATEEARNKLEKIQGVAQATSDAISDLADEILGFGKANIDAERAALQFEEQLAALNEQASQGAMTLDVATEAGRDNRAMLLDMAEATSRSAASAAEAGKSQEEVTAIVTRGRDALIDAATAFYGSRDAAAAYIDTILAAPETIAAQAKITGIEEAEAQLAALTADREARVFISRVLTGVEAPTNWVEKHAGGGTIGYAQGGTIIRAATGRTIPGIGGGVTNGTVWGRGTSKSDSVHVRLSRGEEVIQEPYASLNRDLLKSINRGDFHQGMMQPQVIVQSAGGAGLTLQQTINPTRGMSEREVAQITVDKAEFAFESAGGI